MSLILRILALVAFILALFKLNVDFSLVALGLAFWVTSTFFDNAGAWPGRPA